ncbi:MAG: HAD family phosphatase [Pseudomonadales bacterium]|nr:HAD family phosphatase [Pseudomonadales bacterium]
MILFHDVDGCLNGTDGNPLGFTEETLSVEHATELANLGELLDLSDVEHFIINTGRTWYDTEYLCNAINSRKARYALVEHGSSLWDIQSGQQIDLVTLSKKLGLEHASAALATIERVQELIIWFRSGGNNLLANIIDARKPLLLHGNQSGNLTIPVPEGKDGDAVMAAFEKIIQEQPEFAEDSFTYHHSRSDGFIDVMGTVDKGLGVELTIEYLDYDPSKTVAIGNGLNDLSMLSKVALPICPENAEPLVKNMCKDSGISSEHRFIEATRAWLSTRI